jgi:hypothetical protein
MMLIPVMIYGADAGAMLAGLAVLPPLCTAARKWFREHRMVGRARMSEEHGTVPVVIVLTDVAAVLGSATTGAVIGAVSQRSGARRAERQAAQTQARDLFGQIANAAVQIETEKAIFRERRDSWRPSLHAAGQAFLELGAAWHSGNLLNGAAAAIRSVREWDMAEGARCTERIQAVSAQANPALISLSLLSPQLQAACSSVAGALAGAVRARRRKHMLRASEDLSRAVSELRAAVCAFTEPRHWKPWQRPERRRRQD